MIYATISRHALKGQKLLAQGSALGNSCCSSAPCKGKSFKNIRFLIYRLMVHVNETIVIKSSSSKMAEWVKKLKAHKAEQLEKLRNVEKCDFEFQF